MKDKKPLKRAQELIPYSRDHHHGLLLGWKIRTGIAKGIGVVRISAYVSWFYENHLSPHFELEEKYIFPVLGSDHPLIKRAWGEHQEIRSIMALPLSEAVLVKLADLLKAHIRFEEREIFGVIQDVATNEELAMIEQVHQDKFTEHWDEFWK